jgi:hypothetical protein
MSENTTLPKVKAGKLIAIEGCDGVGKATQSQLLCDALNAKGKKTVLYSFPNYESDTGKEIRHTLKNKKLDTHKDILKFAYLQAINRNESSEEIAKHLIDGTNVVCDRYIGSMLAYGAAMMLQLHEGAVVPNVQVNVAGGSVSAENKAEIYAKYFVMCHKELEFGYLDVIYPDVEVRLVLSDEYRKAEYERRCKEDPERIDLFESNFNFQDLVNEIYLTHQDSDVSQQALVSYSTANVTKVIAGDMFGSRLSKKNLNTVILSSIYKYL